MTCTSIIDIWYEDLCTFIVPGRVLRMRSVREKKVVD